MYFLYDFLLILILLGILPVYLLSPKKIAKYRQSLKPRLGIISDQLRQVLIANQGKWLWLHAVSVGEVNAVIPLVRRIKEKHPDLPILVSTVTETGQQLAIKRLEAVTGAIIYFPLDFSWIAGRIINLVQPRLFVMAETEIWPNFLHQLRLHNIPAVIINGRISAKSFHGYCKIIPFIRRVLADIAFFSMRTQEDAERILALRADPKQVNVTGNIKFDGLLRPPEESERVRMLTALGIPENAPVLVAGSTHSGEEKPLLHAYRKLLANFANLRLIIVPRHLDRLGEIERLISQAGFKFIRKSNINGKNPPKTVIIVDSIGELAMLYGISSLAFVGGSFVPKGGQNILEPAALGKPVLFGPHMDNFQEERYLILSAQAGIQVADADELADHAARLLADPQLAGQLGNNALNMVEQNRGATARTIGIIERYLE